MADGSPLDHLLEQVLDRITTRYERSGDGLTGVSELDHPLGPLEAGRTLLITASTRGDATSMALQIVVRALRSGHAVTLTSHVWSVSTLLDQIVALVAKVNFHTLDRGGLTEYHWDRVMRALAMIRTWPLAISDSISKLSPAPAHNGPSGAVPVIVIDGIDLALGTSSEPIDHLDISSQWIVTTRPEFDWSSWRTLDARLDLVRQGPVLHADVDRANGATLNLALISYPGLGFIGRIGRPDDQPRHAAINDEAPDEDGPADRDASR